MRIYRYVDLQKQGIPYSRQYLARLERAGKFPKRFKLVAGTGQQGSVGWNADAIDEYLRARETAPVQNFLSVQQQQAARGIAQPAPASVKGRQIARRLEDEVENPAPQGDPAKKERQIARRAAG